MVTLAGTSHLGANRCVTGLMERFIEVGKTKGLDTSCAKEQHRPPFAMR